MKKKLGVFVAILAVAAGAMLTATAMSAPGGRPGSAVVVFVTSQGLYYDSIIGPDLPPKGPFQVLEMGGPHGGPQTEFGPGDPGYLGGRWKMDMGGGEFHYFSCPLLPPGRENP